MLLVQVNVTVRVGNIQGVPHCKHPLLYSIMGDWLVNLIGVRNRSRRDQGSDCVPQEKGYDCKFVETPPEGLQTKCPICNFVLREPTQLQCCGNVYCAGCIKKELSTRQTCPIVTCQEPNPTSFPDKQIQKSLLELRVYCIHRAREGEREKEGEGVVSGLVNWVNSMVTSMTILLKAPR